MQTIQGPHMGLHDMIGGDKISKDKILDIAEFAMPATWQKTMVLQGFDPMSHMVNKFIEFCKRLKFAKG